MVTVRLRVADVMSSPPSRFWWVDAELPFLSVEDLDAMTPDQRLAAFRERVVTDPAELPAEFRNRIYETARRLASERRSHQ